VTAALVYLIVSELAEKDINFRVVEAFLVQGMSALGH
jgi:hypothetical protein